MHGTPGARRQIPLEARTYADQQGLRIIGIDRPGIGSSTPHLYPNVLDWTARSRDPARHPRRRHGPADRPLRRGPVRAGRRRRAARPGARRRACSVAWRRPAAPTRPTAASSSSPSGSRRCSSPRGCRSASRSPAAIRLVRPLAGPGLDLYAAVQPPGRQEPAVAPRVQGDVPRRPAQRQPVPDLRPAQRPGAVHPALGLRARRRARAGAVVARRRRPHRAVRARPAHGRPAARRPPDGDRRGEPPRRPRHRPRRSSTR